MSEEIEDKKTDEASGTSAIMLALILIGGIVIGAGGYFAFTLLTAQNTDEDVEQQAEVIEEETPEATETPKEDLSYIEIKRLPAAILDKDGTVTGYVFLDLKIEVLTDNEPEYVQVRLPRIQAAMLKDIATHGVTLADKPGVIDYDGLNERFTKVGNEAIGGDRIRAVFVFRAIRS